MALLADKDPMASSATCTRSRSLMGMDESSQFGWGKCRSSSVAPPAIHARRRAEGCRGIGRNVCLEAWTALSA